MENKNYITTAIIILVTLVLGYFSYNRLFYTGNRRYFAAIQRGDIESVKKFLSYGMSLEARDESYDFTPLMAAAFSNERNMVEFLLETGANVKVKNVRNFTPARVACMADDNGILKLLLVKGAEMDVPDDKGYTPLMAAASHGYDIHINVLLQKGSAAINKADFEGNTPLIYAVMKGKNKTVELLLQKGADAKILNKEGKTAIDLAKDAGFTDVVALMENVMNKGGK